MAELVQVTAQIDAARERLRVALALGELSAIDGAIGVSVRGCAYGTTQLTVVVEKDEAALPMSLVDRLRAGLRAETGAAAEPCHADALVRIAMMASASLEEQRCVSTETSRAVCESAADEPERVSAETWGSWEAWCSNRQRRGRSPRGDGLDTSR